MEKHVFNTSINVWLLGIDSSPLKNQEDLDSININCVKFLCQPDLVKNIFQASCTNECYFMQFQSSTHLTAKRGLNVFRKFVDSHPKSYVTTKRKKRRFNALIENEGNDCTTKWNNFQYKSFTELMMSELEDN